MALTQSALSELFDAFRTGDGVDMIRESVRTVMQELVEYEAASAVGAQRYERTEDRITTDELAVVDGLVRQAKDQGVALTGPNGLLKALTKTVIEAALDEEMTEHWATTSTRSRAGTGETPGTGNGPKPSSPMPAGKS